MNSSINVTKEIVSNSLKNSSLNNAITNSSQVVVKTTHKFLGIQTPFTGNTLLDIFIISLILSLISSLVIKYFSDQEKLKHLRDKMKHLQKEQKRYLKEKNTKKMQEVQKELMHISMENMKLNFNPKIMVLNMLPIIIVLSSLKTGYSSYASILNLGFIKFGWFGTYIIFSIINSIILKKVLDIA